MRRIVCLCAGLAVLCLATSSAQGAAKKNKIKHPHWHHALWELHHAHHELKESNFDFGDHRPKAQAAIADAIKQVDAALAKAGDAPTGKPTKRDVKEEYKNYPSHPHLHHALHVLRHAHKQLKESKHDLGARDAALRDVDRAIHNVTVLLEHAKKTG